MTLLAVYFTESDFSSRLQNQVKVLVSITFYLALQIDSQIIEEFRSSLEKEVRLGCLKAPPSSCSLKMAQSLDCFVCGVSYTLH